MSDFHPDDELIDSYLNNKLTTDALAAFEVRLLQEPSLLERVQLIEAMKSGLGQSDALLVPPRDTVVYSMGSWLRQPLSMAASVIVAILVWPAWLTLSGNNAAESALGIATIVLVEQSRGSEVIQVQGAAPYLLQLDAGLGNSAESFSVTLSSDRLQIRNEGLQADADGWVRLVVPTAPSGTYDTALEWTDTAGEIQQRRFMLELLP